MSGRFRLKHRRARRAGRQKQARYQTLRIDAADLGKPIILIYDEPAFMGVPARRMKARMIIEAFSLRRAPLAREQLEPALSFDLTLRVDGGTMVTEVTVQ